ncbi:MAG: hypothetical protein OXE02_09865 [Chloroflexi bacterium]|nr:hypothetical protein [Chloroflexota bacterium]
MRLVVAEAQLLHHVPVWLNTALPEFFPAAVVLMLVTALLPDVPLALFLVRLQVAREFHDGLGRFAVDVDQPVNDAPKLVQPEVDGGIGKTPVAPGLVAVGCVRVRADHVALQNNAVIRQAVVRLGVAEVGMVRIPGLHSLVIPHPILQMRQDVADGLEAEMRMAVREGHVSNPGGLLLIQPPLVNGYLPDGFGVFRIEQARGDGIAFFEREVKPALAEQFRFRQARCGLVALEFLAPTARKIEGALQLQALGGLLEIDVLALPQALENALSFRIVQGALRFDVHPDTQVVDLLRHAELLRGRHGTRRSPFAVFEQAPPGVDRLERTLEEDDVSQRVPLAGVQVVMEFLRFPDGLELRLVHGAVRIEAHSGAEAHRLALFVARSEEFAECLAALFESNIESAQVLA